MNAARSPRSPLSSAFVAIGASLLGASVAGNGGCSGFGKLPSSQRLEVTYATPAVAPRDGAISFTAADDYVVNVQSLKPDGSVDTSFNGYVRLSSKPGTVTQVQGPGANGRNVLLTNGVANQVTVSVLAAFGPTRVWADDLGYVPADPARNPPPQCSDGRDNNGDGRVDYPNDPGCYAANDDTEDGGTYAAGASPAVVYQLPRIADVRGISQGGNATSFPHEQVDVDTGYRGENNWTYGAHDCLDSTCGGVVVTRVSSDGFYVTDLGDDDPTTGRGYASVFAYNFSAPPNMRQCDRLRTFGGTSSDFFGFTEVNYPTWELEEWDPTQRPCLIPEPHLLAPTCTITGGTRPDCFAISDVNALLKVEAALVRVASQDGIAIQISSHFGAASPPGPDYTPTADATNCDLNHDGKIDRTAGSNELTCSNNCDNDLANTGNVCSEFSNYLSQNSFRLGVSLLNPDGSVQQNGTVPILANGSTDAQFDPVFLKGKPLRSFTGTLRYFSGGSQFTIEARCADDIVTDLNAPPVPSDTACVHARTILDNSAGSN